MNQFTIPNIPVATDLDTLRLSVTNAMSKLVGQLNAMPTQLDGNNQRVINVAIPTGPNDAVPLRYLRYFHDTNTQVSNLGRKGLDAYTIVYANSGTATTTNQSPPFVVGSDRTGVPEEGWLVTVGTASTTLSVNFLHGTDVASCTNTMLATNIELAGATGPGFQTAFNASMSLAHGDVIIMKIINGGGASDFTGGLVVRRS